MAGYIDEARDPRKFQMKGAAIIGSGGLFALAAGTAYLLDRGAPGSALQAGALAAGAAVALAGLEDVGLLSNRVHGRFTATADGYHSEFGDGRLSWLLRFTAQPAASCRSRARIVGWSTKRNRRSGRGGRRLRLVQYRRPSRPARCRAWRIKRERPRRNAFGVYVCRAIGSAPTMEN